MNWIVAHIYVVLIGIAGFALVASGFVLTAQVPTEPSTTANWGRAGGFAFINTPSLQRVSQKNEQLEKTETGTYSVINVKSALESSQRSPLPQEWETLLSQLTSPHPEVGGSAVGEDSSESVYSFIPQGMVSLSEPPPEKTPQQEELYEYGNRVGGLIQEFESSHADMLVVLKDAYADRSNTAKRIAAERIGEDYEKLGRDIAEITPPESASSMHTGIADAYQDAGKKMVLKLRTTTDEEFLAAMHTYNNSVLEFTNNFVALATHFSLSGVRFSSSDPGSVFTFRAL
jgi:hypothetical protein